MTSNQQFSLKWTNYTSHIANVFSSFRSEEDYCDATLCCEGRTIVAHKIILSACSMYLRKIFKENPSQHSVIIFKNIKYDDLLAIVDYMYQGEVNIEEGAITTFLKTAELLIVHGLVDVEEEDLYSPIQTIIAPKQQSISIANPTNIPLKENIRSDNIHTAPPMISGIIDNN